MSLYFSLNTPVIKDKHFGYKGQLGDKGRKNLDDLFEILILILEPLYHILLLHFCNDTIIVHIYSKCYM